jgi:hypothetical protein
MTTDNGHVAIALQPASFGEKELQAVRHGGLTVSLSRYETGVEAIRLVNAPGM